MDVSREQLQAWYEVDRLSMREIGQRCGVSATIISKRFRRFGIPAKNAINDGRFLFAHGHAPIWKTRPRQQPTLQPSINEIAWAAGVYEGEGCCLTYKKKQKPTYVTLRIQLCQKDRWLLDRLQALFGGTVTIRKGYGPHTTDLFAWNLYGPRARGFLLTIFTWMSPRRRQQIRQAIERS